MAIKEQKAIKESEEIHGMVLRSSIMTYGTWKSNADAQTAKKLLEKGAFFKDGESWKYTAKHIGLGIYELRLVLS